MYTGVILELDMAIVRLIAAMLTGSIIGLVMVTVFKKEETDRRARYKSSVMLKSARSVIELRKLALLVLNASTTKLY